MQEPGRRLCERTSTRTVSLTWFCCVDRRYATVPLASREAGIPSKQDSKRLPIKLSEGTNRQNLDKYLIHAIFFFSLLFPNRPAG